MKIAYLGKIQLSDTDLPLLHEAQKLADITYYMEVCPRFLTGPAYDIKTIYPKTGIFKATEVYPDLDYLSDFIDVEKFYVVNTAGRLWQLKSFYTNLLLLLHLLRHRYNVIHVAWPLNVYEFILYFLKKKMILTVHDPFPHSALDTFIVRLRRKFAFSFIDKLIILNQSQRKAFIDYYHLDESRVVGGRLSACTYLRYSAKKNPVQESPDEPYVLFAGKISPYKGVDYLLPAFVKIHDKFPGMKLIVAGEGKFHFDISPYQMVDYIEFRNRFVTDKELVGLIKNCLFMVCPYTDATQSGVIMSSYAFDKPVIATRVGGLPEMVGDRYGLLVKERDVEALAEGMKTLLQDKQLLQTFSQNIHRDYAAGDKSWLSIAEQYLKEYAKINQSL